MASRTPWDSKHCTPASESSITRFIKGNRMTWFYGLWFHHKGSHWALWLDCPKKKVVRLVLLFTRDHDTQPSDNGWLAPVVPIGRALGKGWQQRRNARP